MLVMKSIAWVSSIGLWAAAMVNAESSWAKMPLKHRFHYSNNPNDHGKHVGAYYPSYYKDKYPLSDVIMSLYSDVYFFVTKTMPTPVISLDTASGVTGSDVKAFVAAAKLGGSRPILSIGGWTASIYFSSDVATAKNRTAFVKSISNFYNKYNFEGVDIDWEYPNDLGIGCNVVSANDTANLILFFQDLRQALPTAYLSMAARMTGIVDGATGVAALDLTALSQILDVVNVMTYDAWGSWSVTTGPVAPFSDACANDGLSVQKSVQIFLDQKFTRCQIVVGIPTYGSSWTTLKSTLKKTTVGDHTSLLYQAKSPITPKGPEDDENPGPDACGNPQTYGGTWPVVQLVEHNYLSTDLTKGKNGYERYFDGCSGTPFLFNKKTRHFISYDDIDSSVEKAKYVKAMGLGGIFFFDTSGALPTVVSAAVAAL